MKWEMTGKAEMIMYYNEFAVDGFEGVLILRFMFCCVFKADAYSQQAVERAMTRKKTVQTLLIR